MRRSDLIPGAAVCLVGAAALWYGRWKNWEKLTPAKRKYILFGIIIAMVWALIQVILVFV
jgi:hypothetical protein